MKFGRYVLVAQYDGGSPAEWSVMQVLSSDEYGVLVLVYPHIPTSRRFVPFCSIIATSDSVTDLYEIRKRAEVVFEKYRAEYRAAQAREMAAASNANKRMRNEMAELLGIATKRLETLVTIRVKDRWYHE